MLQSLMVFLWYQLDCEVATIIVISIYLGRICGSERVSHLPVVTELVDNGDAIQIQSLESFSSASQSAKPTGFGSGEGGSVCLGTVWSRDPGLAPKNIICLRIMIRVAITESLCMAC